MLSEFLLKLLNGIGPLDRFGCLIVISDVFLQRSFESIGTEKVIGLQVFALQETEPDFDLIQPGGVGGQPMDLKMGPSVTHLFLLLEPAFELLGRVSCSIIENEDHGMDLTAQRFGNDLLLHKGLEIDKTFAASTRSVDVAISHRKSSKQMTGTTTMIACFVQHGLASMRCTRRLLTLTGLNGGFLIQADQPDTLTQEGLGLTISVQDWTGSLQKGDGIMNVLPGVIAPGTKTFCLQPATHRAARNAR